MIVILKKKKIYKTRRTIDHRDKHIIRIGESNASFPRNETPMKTKQNWREGGHEWKGIGEFNDKPWEKFQCFNPWKPWAQRLNSGF